MNKKVFLIVNMFCLALFFSFANAQEYTIGNYDFTWRAAKVGDVENGCSKISERCSHTPEQSWWRARTPDHDAFTGRGGRSSPGENHGILR